MDLLTFSDSISDPRRGHYKAYSSRSIFYIALCAVICGAESWYDVEEFGHYKKEFFRSRLPCFTGIPSHDTFNRFFSILDPLKFESVFREWASSLCKDYRGHLAIDGKCIHPSGGNTVGVHMVSAWASECGISLGQVAVDEKSNEIPAIKELIDSLDLRDCLVTIDAMGCHKEIVEGITKQKGDYLICVKKNQKNLYKSIVSCFESVRAKRDPSSLKGHIRYDYCISSGIAHGRKETRETLVYNNGILEKMYPAWKGLKTIVEVTNERVQLPKAKVEKQRRYYITSLSMNAQEIQQKVRQHWSIENNLHWQMDVSFREDQDRKIKTAARNFSLICKVALTLLKKDKKKVSIKTKRKVAGWAEEYLEQVIMQKNL